MSTSTARPGLRGELWRRKPVGESANPHGPRLERTIGTFQLTMFGVGATIGTGIFFVLGQAVPEAGPAVIVASYTHPEYAISMGEVFERMQATALLLRGTEGEVVADARRLPQMEGFIAGRRVLLEAGRKGTLTDLPDLPQGTDATTTAAYIRAVLDGGKPVPASVGLQVEHILRLARGE